MRFSALALLLACSTGYADDDYLISPRDAPEARSYNERADDQTADYDHDAVPNWLDGHNDQEPKPKWMQDWDGDGDVNALDLQNDNE